jgi:hypothetical protein
MDSRISKPVQLARTLPDAPAAHRDAPTAHRSQRWDAETGLPPFGARVVKQAGANEWLKAKLERT